MARKALCFNNSVEKCRVKDSCDKHLLHVGDVLQYVEGSARILKIRDDGLKVVFLRKMNGRRKRLKTGETWKLRSKDIRIMPLPERFDSFEEWLKHNDSQ